MISLGLRNRSLAVDCGAIQFQPTHVLYIRSVLVLPIPTHILPNLAACALHGWAEALGKEMHVHVTGPCMDAVLQFASYMSLPALLIPISETR